MDIYGQQIVPLATAYPACVAKWELSLMGTISQTKGRLQQHLLFNPDELVMIPGHLII